MSVLPRLISVLIPAYSLTVIAFIHFEADKFGQALGLFNRAMEKYRRPNIRTKLFLHRMMGRCQFQMWQFWNALVSFEIVYAGGSALLGDRHGVIVWLLIWKGRCYLRLKQYERALGYSQRAYETRAGLFGIASTLLGDPYVAIAMIFNLQGRSLLGLGRPQDPLVIFQLLCINSASAFGETRLLFMSALHWKGESYLSLARYEDAVVWFERIQTIQIFGKRIYERIYYTRHKLYKQ